MAQAADLPITPANPWGNDARGRISSRTRLSSPNPSRILGASSRDTDKVPAADQVLHRRRGVIQVEQID